MITATQQEKTQVSDEKIAELIGRGWTRRAIMAQYVLGRARFDRIRAELTRRGWSPEHDMTHTAPDGFHLKGASTLYKDGQPVMQWVKTSIDHERQRDLMLAAVEAMAAELPALPARPAPVSDYRAELMACYPIGDLHVGMYSDPDETGDAWNLALAEQVQCGAMAELVERAPACEKATIVNLGDWMHASNLTGTTSRSGHVLDMAGRFHQMANVGVKVMRQCIESALAKHRQVHVINITGNHDDTGAIMLAICLAHTYEHEPRVTVDTSPAPAMYFRHGKVFVGCHHGHSIKAGMLPGVMAADRPQDWGETTHRYWWVGHVHHQSLKDYAGVTVESFRTLAAKDAYAAWGGYRSPRDMKCIVLHEEHGEVARHTVNPRMVKVEAA